MEHSKVVLVLPKSHLGMKYFDDSSCEEEDIAVEDSGTTVALAVEHSAGPLQVEDVSHSREDMSEVPDMVVVRIGVPLISLPLRPRKLGDTNTGLQPFDLDGRPGIFLKE